jgi:hypothetical protein
MQPAAAAKAESASPAAAVSFSTTAASELRPPLPAGLPPGEQPSTSGRQEHDARPHAEPPSVFVGVSML